MKAKYTQRILFLGLLKAVSVAERLFSSLTSNLPGQSCVSRSLPRSGIRGLNETMFIKTCVYTVGSGEKGGALCLVVIFKTSWMVLPFCVSPGVRIPRGSASWDLPAANLFRSSPVIFNSALHWLSHKQRVASDIHF